MASDTDPPSSPDPPPEPADFVDFLQKANKNALATFDNSMLRDIADNGLQGKFKDKYDTWFHDKVVREIMEEEEEEKDDK